MVGGGFCGESSAEKYGTDGLSDAVNGDYPGVVAFIRRE